MEEGGRAGKKHGSAKDKCLDKAVLSWSNQERSEETPMLGTILQEQAHLLHSKFPPESTEPFQASKNWLRNFKIRHDISETKIIGERCSTDAETVSAFPPQLRKIIKEGNFKADQIYNWDETDQYFKIMSDRTLA